MSSKVWELAVNVQINSIIKKEKNIEEKIIQQTELDKNLDFSNKNNNRFFYYLKKHANILFDIISPPPEATA